MVQSKCGKNVYNKVKTRRVTRRQAFCREKESSLFGKCNFRKAPEGLGAHRQEGGSPGTWKQVISEKGEGWEEGEGGAGSGWGVELGAM